jgi:hypothetical protein
MQARKPVLAFVWSDVSDALAQDALRPMLPTRRGPAPRTRLAAFVAAPGPAARAAR